MTGRFVGAPGADGPVNNVGWFFKPWYYTHVRAMLEKSSAETLVEYIPVYQYIFRHNRAIFWTLNDQLPEYIGNHILFRYLFGWLNPPMVTFLKLPATPAIRKEMMLSRVYQDITLPISSMEKAILKADELFNIWPILVYPSRIYDHGAESKQGLFRKPFKAEMVHGTNYAMYFDLGVYGIPTQVKEKKQFKAVYSMREMEEFTRGVGGAPFLYADTCMTFKEFNEMFDLTLYNRVRKKYKSDEHFPHVFDKTSGCQSFDWKEVLQEELRSTK